MNKTTMISLKIPKILDRRARVVAANNDISRSELIRRAIEKFVSNEKNMVDRESTN